MQWGATYSYITKYGWSGNNFNSTTGVAGASLRPHAVDNMFLDLLPLLPAVVQARQFAAVPPLGTDKGQLFTELPLAFCEG